jgi:membrane protease YdiL (CAAX protease family)
MKLEFNYKSNAVAGYLIFSFIFSIIFSLYFQDALFYAFTLFILMALILATAIDVGDINKDLSAVGWSSTGINMAIPLGVVGGILAVVIGSVIINVNISGLFLTVPDLTAVSKIFTKASVISPIMAVSANIFSQWLVVAPAEESFSKIIAPFAGILTFKNKPLAFAIAILLWVGMHVPTFIMQGASSNMYFVLIILGVITTGLYFITNSIITPIIAHGTYNTIVIMSGASSNIYSTLTILTVAAILIYVWMKNYNNPKKSGA